jgi:hypothetical protein
MGRNGCLQGINPAPPERPSGERIRVVSRLYVTSRDRGVHGPPGAADPGPAGAARALIGDCARNVAPVCQRSAARPSILHTLDI